MYFVNFFALFLNFIFIVSASLSGPYLLWGHEKLQEIQLPALIEAPEQSLSTLFKDAKAVVIFIRNDTHRLDGVSLPKFKQMIEENFWSYLPQRNLAVEPFNYNTNIEVINLSGSIAQQDDELYSLYNDSVTIYGSGEVLGILSNREDENHFVYKREAKEGGDEVGTATTTSISPTDEPTERNFVYKAEGKAILYTTSAPVLNLEINGKKHSFELMEHDKEITFDDRPQSCRLNIGFKVDNSRLRLRFNFTLSTQYWTLKTVEVEFKEYRNTLPLIGNQYNSPSAPRGFSYRCSTRAMVFRSGEDNLTIKDYQIQPWLKGGNRFSEAFDCVGVITVPILSGVFISLFLTGILFIGILVLMDVKTPSRFENARGQQMTFIVQE